LCGCPSSIFYDCQDNGNCNKKIYQYPNCRGITCNGFCYNSRFEMDCIENSFVEADSFIPEIRPCRDDSDCKSYVYNERTIKTYCDEATNRCDPYGIGGINVTLKVPESVQINSEFNFTLSITNKNDYSMDFQINPPDFHNQVGALCPENGTGLCYRYKNESDIRQITLEQQEKRDLVYKIKTGDPSMISQIIIGSNFFDVYSNPIIVYDPSKSITKCGNKIYNNVGSQAVCIDNILYPIQNCPTEDCMYKACYSNDDCGSGICFDHYCVSVYPPDFEPNKFYKISVTPLYLSRNMNELNEQKANISLTINKMIKNANEWFRNEKKYWNTTSNFSVEYDLIECDIGINEYLSILKESKRAKQTLNNISKKCLINREEYPIVAFIHVYGKDFDQELANEMSKAGFSVSAGHNYGNAITSGYGYYSVLIHETFHSFGMFDIYAHMGTFAENYHLHDCLLFRAMWDPFEENPHLCPIEAFVIGWFNPEKT